VHFHMAAVRNVSQQGRISRDNGFYNFWADKRKGCDGNPLASRTGVDHGLSQVATQFGSVENAQLPARRPGGLYKIRCHKHGGFVEASPPRVLEGETLAQRFLMLKPSEQEQAAPSQINVVLNWFEEFKQKVPPGNN